MIINNDDPNDNIADSESFKYKVKITGKTPVEGNIKDFEIIVPLKYISNFGELLKCHKLIVKSILN